MNKSGWKYQETVSVKQDGVCVNLGFYYVFSGVYREPCVRTWDSSPDKGWFSSYVPLGASATTFPISLCPSQEPALSYCTDHITDLHSGNLPWSTPICNPLLIPDVIWSQLQWISLGSKIPFSHSSNTSFNNDTTAKSFLPSLTFPPRVYRILLKRRITPLEEYTQSILWNGVIDTGLFRLGPRLPVSDHNLTQGASSTLQMAQKDTHMRCLFGYSSFFCLNKYQDIWW